MLQRCEKLHTPRISTLKARASATTSARKGRRTGRNTWRFSVSLPKGFKTPVSKAIKSFNSRSAYFAELARKDLTARNLLPMQP